MKRAPFICVFAVICLFIAAVPVSGAEAGKIGIIDFQKLLLESDAGKAIQAEIQRKGRSMESDLRKLGDEIESMMEQLQRGAMVMSPERREQQQRELEIRRYDFQAMQQKYQYEFREMEAMLVEQFRDEVFAIAETLGKQEGYILIIERNAAIYFPSTIDLTDKVIQVYNEQFGG